MRVSRDLVIFIDFIDSSDMQSRGWISQRSTKAKEESYKLGVKQFNKIKSNSSLKVEQKSLKSTVSYKAFGPKNSTDTKSSGKSQSKRNKSYDYYNKNSKVSRRTSKEKEYKRVKEYIQSKNTHRDSEGSPIMPRPDNKISKRETNERMSYGNDSNNISSEESKIMKKKKLSIEIPDSSENTEGRIDISGISIPKDLGPHRSISVQNRTTTITQFSSLNPQDQSDPLFNLAPTKIDEIIPLKPGKDIIVPNFESTKTSVKRNGVVSAYAANTHQGIVRSYNEDRVSIILNIVKPPSRKDEVWPK